VGPNHSLNPATIWRFVVMQGAAYVALRASGPRYGLLTGLLGGFVSSTAMVAVMGRRAVDEPLMCRLATAAEVSSSVATVVLLAAVIGAGSIRVPPEMALPLILASVAGAATNRLRLTCHTPTTAGADRAGRAFGLPLALLLAAAVASVFLVAGPLNAAVG
jgi:uncharacterized membrane protein (DUF4010 family)